MEPELEPVLESPPDKSSRSKLEPHRKLIPQILASPLFCTRSFIFAAPLFLVFANGGQRPFGVSLPSQ